MLLLAITAALVCFQKPALPGKLLKQFVLNQPAMRADDEATDLVSKSGTRMPQNLVFMTLNIDVHQVDLLKWFQQGGERITSQAFRV